MQSLQDVPTYKKLTAHIKCCELLNSFANGEQNIHVTKNRTQKDSTSKRQELNTSGKLFDFEDIVANGPRDTCSRSKPKHLDLTGKNLNKCPAQGENSKQMSGIKLLRVKSLHLHFFHRVLE